MRFLDTNALINADLSKEDRFVLSSISLQELESIKTNKNKTEDLRAKVRATTRWLDKNEDKYDVVVYDENHEALIKNRGIEVTPDSKIIACAYIWHKDEVVFVTDDIACKNIARKIFGLKVVSLGEGSNDENYTGFKEVVMSDTEMAYFYENQDMNMYELFTNEYLIIKNLNNEIVDKLRWCGNSYQQIYKKPIKSLYFEKLKCKDVYQECVIDSLMNNTITAISGKAGSGKSLLSLMAAMRLIEDGKFERIVILFNPTKARGASDLGFYGGTFEEKAMQNSIGQILTTKFGDRYAVDLLMQQNRLKLVSMADCRGMEINDSEILWITEAQNTSIDLIKLALSRVSSGAKVFIEGDYSSQVDSWSFEGNNNGLKRVIDVFKNHEEFGYIQLQNVWRSKIAELCELL